ncbi:MAG: GspH/FimT family protein [Thermodesulfobacteriota bacterium]
MLTILNTHSRKCPRSQGSSIVVASNEKGLTVIEILVAIGILAILLATAAVGLGALAPKFNLDNGVRTVAMALHQARVQAITRGHTIEVVFDSTGFTITDATSEDEVIAGGEVSSGIVLSPSDVISFTPLGTAAAPQTVSVSNGDYSRSVSVGLTGEVVIE